jgi:hypothetical protein
MLPRREEEQAWASAELACLATDGAAHGPVGALVLVRHDHAPGGPKTWYWSDSPAMARILKELHLCTIPCYAKENVRIYPPARYAQSYQSAEESYRLLGQGRVKDSLAKIQAAITANPREPRFLVQQAKAHLHDHEPMLAFADLDRAIELAAWDPDLLVARCEARLSQFIGERRQGNTDRALLEAALADASHAIELDPDAPQYYRLRGKIHFALSHRAEAINDQDKAKDLELIALAKQIIAARNGG